MSAMSDTAWKISHTHQRVGEECTCGGFRSALARDHSHHIAAVTEAAVREQVSRDIKAWITEQAADGVLRTDAWSDGVSYGAYAAADVAHGGAA